MHAQTNCSHRKTEYRTGPSKVLLLAASLAVAVSGIPKAEAGFTISGGTATPLDGQTVDWITITGAGSGTMLFGTLNVGVQGLTDAGNLTIENNGLLDADQEYVPSGGGASTQGAATINVGPQINVFGGLMHLNQDTVNVLGRTDTLQQGELNVSAGGEVQSINSDIRVNGTVSIRGSETLFHQAGSSGSLTFSDELSVRDGAVLTSDGTGAPGSGTISASGTAGPGGLARGDIIVDGSTMNLFGGTVDITAGTSGALRLDGGSLDVSGTEINVHGFEAYGGSTASVHNGADLQASGSAVIREGSTLNVDNTSRFTIGGDLRVNTGGQATIRNDIAPHNAFIENPGSLLDIANSSLNATLGSVIVNDGARYNHNVGSLTTATSLEIRDFSRADVTDVAVTVGRNFTVTNGSTGGSTYVQTHGILNIGTNWDVYGGSGVTLTDVALTSGDFGLIHNSSSFVQSGGSITTGGRFQVDNSNASLTNVDLTTGAGAGVILSNGAIYTQSGGKISSGEILQVTGANTTADLTDVHLILSSDLQVLDGASYTQKNITSNSALNVGGALQIRGGADVSLSHVDVGAVSVSVENAGSTLSLEDGSLTATSGPIYLTDKAAYTHTTGALSSASSLEVRDGSTAQLTDVAVTVGQNMTVTDGTSGGSSYTQTRGTLSIGTGWDVYGGSSMELTDVALTSGEAGLIQNGSSYSHTGGSLTTGQRFEVNASTATLDGVVVMTQNGAGIILANGATFDQSGGSLSSAEILRIDGGTSTATVENADVSTATNLQVLNGASYTQTNNALTLGGNLEVSGGSSATLNNVSASSYYADVGAGSGLDVTGGSLDVKTKLTVGGAGARLVIQSGGVVTSEGADINGGATATVQGSDSSWTSQLVSGRGDFGVNDGKLDVLGGAKVEVSSGSTVIGRGVDASGEVLVSGPVSTFSNTGAQGDLIVGFEGGTGRLNVEEGGQVQSAYASIGLGAGSAGEAVVTGTGSKWTATAIGIGGGGATGTLTVTDSGLVDADDIFVYEDGNLCGSGNVDANVQVMGGTICPGNSPGTLNILGNGNFILDSGILEIQVGGLSSGDYDVLNVTGNAHLNGGTILFSFIGGFLPEEGDYLPFLTAGGEITIDSNNVIYAYEGAGPGFLFAVDPGDGGLIFRAENDATSGVPAPGTLWLLGVGIAAGLRCSRRRAA